MASSGSPPGGGSDRAWGTIDAADARLRRLRNVSLLAAALSAGVDVASVLGFLTTSCLRASGVHADFLTWWCGAGRDLELVLIAITSALILLLVLWARALDRRITRLYEDAPRGAA